MEDYMKDMTFHKSPSTYHFKFTIQSSTEFSIEWNCGNVVFETIRLY